MHALFRRVARFASADAPVVILGESGTGKEVVARALHVEQQPPGSTVPGGQRPPHFRESSSNRSSSVTFAAPSPEPPPSKKGLSEAADGGMLFLDEVAEMPLALQAKLLRVLQDGEIRRVGDTRPFAVNVRVVCATHRGAGASRAAGLFREDLYYRLKVLTVRVPPLRERPRTSFRWPSSSSATRGTWDAHLTPEAAQVLLSYGWPGNVRELASAMKHGIALAPGGVVRSEDLPEDSLRRAPVTASSPAVRPTCVPWWMSSATTSFRYSLPARALRPRPRASSASAEHALAEASPLRRHRVARHVHCFAASLDGGLLMPARSARDPRSRLSDSWRPPFPSRHGCSTATGSTTAAAGTGPSRQHARRAGSTWGRCSRSSRRLPRRPP